MHEIGIVSGFAAAYRLGARYPFTADKDCKRLFALYLAASHGCRMVSRLVLAFSLDAAAGLTQRFLSFAARRGSRGLLPLGICSRVVSIRVRISL